MPRVTRNFWIEAIIDGRRTRLEGGPQGRRGEFELTVYIRDNGGVLRAMSVSGTAQLDGTLTVSAAAAGDVAQSNTGRVIPGPAGFQVTTQAGYKDRPARSSSARLTRELLSNPPAPPIPEPEPPADCRYLSNDVPSREACFCASCRIVLEAEQERETAAFGTDPFGRAYPQP